MNVIAAAVLMEMVAAYEGTTSYDQVIIQIAGAIKATLPGTKWEQLLGRTLSDLGAALQSTQPATTPAKPA